MSAEQEHGHQWTAPVLATVLLAVEAVIAAESWRGLTGFAHLIGITGVAAWGVPVTLDGVSLVAALTALRAELAGESSGIYRVVLFAFTGGSAAANYWHAWHERSTEAALYFGGMSIAVAVVFSLALRQIRSEDRRKAGRVTARLPRFSVAHWARFPRLTWRAWSLSVRDGHTSPRDALDAALGRAGDMSVNRDANTSGIVARTATGTGAGTVAGTPAGTGFPALGGPARQALPGPVPDEAAGPVRSRPSNRPARRRPGRSRGATDEDAETEFAAEIAAGQVPTLYQIRNRLHVGNDRAKVLRQHIARQALTT